jgi:hypothetical protein
MRLNTIYPLVAVFFLALTANAVAASAGWTPTQAAAKVKATYTTVDQKTYDWAKEHNYASAMKAALHGAKPTAVACKGSGKAAGGRYSRFHCTAQVKSVMAPIPPDYVLYTATVKVTVTVTGSRWRILNGWR